ncbi:MAG: hypothetical protein KGI49_01470 [Patescibacteria group bacterium]|nr:hypothetical protein [Patescibacteria group bacterium]
MNNRTLVAVSVVVGVLFVLLAIYYWVTPAGSLPSFMPGFESGSAHVHLKHGLASFIVGLGVFAYAWFKGGKRGATIR